MFSLNNKVLLQSAGSSKLQNNSYLIKNLAKPDFGDFLVCQMSCARECCRILEK